MARLISILIPCLNAEHWVAQAIESALTQTWPEKEVIVVDDGSTDGSLNEIRKFDSRIRWETGPNRGGNVARNRLLELAQGEWLQYLDADDYLVPDKLSRQMDFLARCSKTDIMFGPVTLEYWSEVAQHRVLQPIPLPHDPWVLLARWYLPQTGSPIWRRTALELVGGWEPTLPCCQEHELYLRMLMNGMRFTYCPCTGSVYRQWSKDTVCTRDVREVHRQRLRILQRAENYLSERNELTPARRWAINQGRFETARIAWQYDRDYAVEIMTAVGRSDPGFMPFGDAAPKQYVLAYKMLGFGGAEKMAALKRFVSAM